MAEVQPRDILLRIGGRTLQRYGALAVGLSRGRMEEFKETFTRPAQVRRFRDRDGIGRKAAAGNVAVEYPGELSGLVDQFGYPYCGPKLDGARVQLVIDPENFGLWDAVGTPVLTPGQADPFGGTAAYLVNDDDGAAQEYIRRTVPYTGNATKAQLCFLRAGTAAQTELALVADGFGQRVRITITWTAGVATAVIGGGSGTARVVPWSGGWYLIEWTADGVLAAEVNRYTLFPAGATAANTGTVYFFGANAWDAPFPSSYQGPGEAAGVAESLIVPCNFGPQDLTILARVARSGWADAVGDVGGGGLYVASIGSAGGSRLSLLAQTVGRNWQTYFENNVGGSSSIAPAILGGTEQKLCVQLDHSIATGARTRIDVGAGFSGYGATTARSTNWINQTLIIGSFAGIQQLYGVLLDLIVFRGLFSLNETLAVP